MTSPMPPVGGHAGTSRHSSFTRFPDRVRQMEKDDALSPGDKPHGISLIGKTIGVLVPYSTRKDPTPVTGAFPQCRVAPEASFPIR